MDDTLKPIATTKKVQSSIEKFESLSLKDWQTKSVARSTTSKPLLEVKDEDNDRQSALNEISSKTLKISKTSDSQFTAIKKNPSYNSTIFLEQSYLELDADKTANLPDEALIILRSKPGLEDLKAVLQYLRYGINGRHSFNVKVSSPKSALVIQVLIMTTIPDIWDNLNRSHLSTEEFEVMEALLASLGSIGGLEALCSQIQLLTRASKENKHEHLVRDYIDVLSKILRHSKTILTFVTEGKVLYESEMSRRMFSQSLTALFAGSRILNAVAQAWKLLDLPSLSKDSPVWMSNGSMYCGWLAENIAHAAIHLPVDDQAWKWLSQLLKRGLSLGHREKLISTMYTQFLFGQRALWTSFHHLIRELTEYDRRLIMDSILLDLSQQYLANNDMDFQAIHDPSVTNAISGAAAMIRGLVDSDEALERAAIDWVSLSSTKYASTGLGIRRALIACLALSQERLERILEKTLTSFGDKLQIQYASVMQQETLMQTILLIIGYVYRSEPGFLKSPRISSLNMHSVSNRLASSIPRCRFLGMIVGVAMSRCVDQPDKVLSFDVEEMESEEAKEWLNLATVKDSVGNISQLESASSQPRKRKKAPVRSKPPVAKCVRQQPTPQTSKIISIEEVSSSSDDEDDLIPYQKPDDDSEDSDEDPTVIDRNKPTAPVYIIDLIKQLQVTDKPHITSLALRTAPSLIRRKANFGSEVFDNIHALVSSLINLQEGMSQPEEQKHRLESLISCVIAKPEIVGRYLAQQYFHGDFSISQRTTILTVLGLSARELAGFADHGNAAAFKGDAVTYKELPPRLQNTFLAITGDHNSHSNPISSLANDAAHATIRPMALAAADSAMGPSVLKIRTFSSRMDVEKRKTAAQAQRTKKIPRNVHAILTNAIYIPLCAPMALLLSSPSHVSAGASNSIILHPGTQRLFLQTLTLIMNTLGPLAAVHLPAITHETLLLLTALHNLPLAQDPVVLPAALHLLLALLDVTVEVGVTAQERLIVDHGRQMAELVNWANGLSERSDAPVVAVGEGEENENTGLLPWTVLAAGIAVKWMEIGKRFQGRMLGLGEDWDEP